MICITTNGRRWHRVGDALVSAERRRDSRIVLKVQADRGVKVRRDITDINSAGEALAAGVERRRGLYRDLLATLPGLLPANDAARDLVERIRAEANDLGVEPGSGPLSEYRDDDDPPVDLSLIAPGPVEVAIRGAMLERMNRTIEASLGIPSDLAGDGTTADRGLGL
jgi:hypothetical protein